MFVRKSIGSVETSSSGPLVKDKRLTIRVANIPNADTFTIHLFAALAQQEREFISQRTKAAMAAAKARGQVFGNPRLAEINRTRKPTRKHTQKIAPIVLPLRKKGMTFQQIADTLNEMGITTSKGGRYYRGQVKVIVDEPRHEGRDRVPGSIWSMASLPDQTQ